MPEAPPDLEGGSRRERVYCVDRLNSSDLSGVRETRLETTIRRVIACGLNHAANARGSFVLSQSFPTDRLIAALAKTKIHIVDIDGFGLLAAEHP